MNESRLNTEVKALYDSCKNVNYIEIIDNPVSEEAVIDSLFMRTRFLVSCLFCFFCNIVNHILWVFFWFFM